MAGKDGRISDHFDGRRFFNPGKPRETTFADFLRWRFGRWKTPWPRHVENPRSDTPPERVHGPELRVSYVGHVTTLIQTRGLNILTDPVWSERASPLTFAGPKRVREPGMRLEDLPPIDVVLVSHNHYDHLDKATLKRLHRDHAPLMLAPLGNDEIILAADPDIRIETMDWGESRDLSDDVSIHLEPMHHWCARGVFDKNKALWGAFVIATPDGPVLFIGDSGYGEGDTFRAHRRKYGSFRLALLPIGAYRPRWFMAEDHMDPDEAVRAYKDLGAHYALATHYETFPLADDGFGEPRRDFLHARQLHQVPDHRFRCLEPGMAWYVPAVDDDTPSS